MPKTRLGVSVGLLAALIYFSGLYNGFGIVLIVLAGYVLLFEADEWLRYSAVKAVAIVVSFAVLNTIIYYVPDFLGWVSTLIRIFKGTFNYSVVSDIISLFTTALSIIKSVILLALGIKALKRGAFAVPFVDNLLAKYL